MQVCEHAIEIAEAKKSFGAKSVLKGFTLSVQKGESFALIGGSGTGKSVIIKCVLGLIPLDKGSIKVNGSYINVKGGLEYNRIGMLFQEAALFDSLQVWQNVAFRLMRGRDRVSKSQAKAIAVEKLNRVGLSADVANLYPADLSGGMKKRVGLARAIAADPDILFFDEPTTGLDPIRANLINQLIRGIVDESKCTAVSITHDMDSVAAIADTVGLLHEGKLAWIGRSEELHTSDNGYVKQFVTGSPSGPMEAAI